MNKLSGCSYSGKTGHIDAGIQLHEMQYLINTGGNPMFFGRFYKCEQGGLKSRILDTCIR